MRPGEYIGKDGRTYRWRRGDTGGWFVEELTTDGIWVISLVQPSTEDWPDAKAALDALIEAESREWVGWTTAQGYHYRADQNGYVERNENGRWVTASPPIQSAYLQGREVAEAEQAEMRDDVRELVDVVSGPSVFCTWAHPNQMRWVSKEWFEAVQSAAKTLEVKL